MENCHLQISYEKYAPGELLDEDIRELIEAALEAAEKSYSPYSRFPVGTAIKTFSGKILAASNQENVAFPAGICAERSVLAYYHSNFPEDPLAQMVILATRYKSKKPLTPCGICRQSIAEIEHKQKSPIQIILHQPGGESLIFDSIHSLLPLAFESF